MALAALVPAPSVVNTRIYRLLLLFFIVVLVLLLSAGS